MNIFNRKLIEELKNKNQLLELENKRLVSENNRLVAKFDAITELEEAMPTDCKKGPWCKACEFSKVYHYREYDMYNRQYSLTCYVCCKGESCKQFVEKIIKE